MFWQTNLFLSQNIKKTKFTLFHQNYLTSFHSKDSCCRHVALGPPNALHYSFNKFTKIAHTHTYHHIGSCIMTENGFSIFFFSSNFIVHSILFLFCFYLAFTCPGWLLLLSSHRIRLLFTFAEKDEWRVTQKMSFFCLFLFRFVSIRILA